MKQLQFLLILMASWGMTGCSHPSSRDRMEAALESSRPNPGVLGMNNFWMDSRSPGDRPVEHWEFYYKHCSLVSRKPFIDGAEYMCTPPY